MSIVLIIVFTYHMLSDYIKGLRTNASCMLTGCEQRIPCNTLMLAVIPTISTFQDKLKIQNNLTPRLNNGVDDFDFCKLISTDYNLFLASNQSSFDAASRQKRNGKCSTESYSEHKNHQNASPSTQQIYVAAWFRI